MQNMMQFRQAPHQRPEVQPPKIDDSVWGRIKAFFNPPTIRDKIQRHAQIRDVSFFVVVTGTCIVFEKTLHNWLVKEASK